MRLAGVDGLLWCCLSDGANNVTYRKPPIDFYGRAKLGFYGMKMGFQPIMACHGAINAVLGSRDAIQPMVINARDDQAVDVAVKLIDEEGRILKQIDYYGVMARGALGVTELPSFPHDLQNTGYYTLQCDVFPANRGEGEVQSPIAESSRRRSG